MHGVAETSIFARRADALLKREDRDNLISTLAADPTAGALVPGLGGIRNCVSPRPDAASQEERPILALLIYAKNEQENITPQQRDALLNLIERDKVERRNVNTGESNASSGSRARR